MSSGAVSGGSGGGGSGGGSPNKGASPHKFFKAAKKGKEGRRIEVDTTHRVVRIYNTMFHERGIFQHALGSSARESGQGFVYAPCVGESSHHVLEMRCCSLSEWTGAGREHGRRR